ncbi:MAG: hypothetical protein RLY35_1325, partial [Bacteroidota bacterium]
MIRIGYAGILEHHLKPKHHWLKAIFEYVWTYRPQAVDPSYRSPLPIFHALSELKENFDISPNKIQFQLWGDIDPYFQKCAKDLRLEEIVVIDGFITHHETISRLKQMDILFLPLEKSNSKQHRNLFVPSKL